MTQEISPIATVAKASTAVDKAAVEMMIENLPHHRTSTATFL